VRTARFGHSSFSFGFEFTPVVVRLLIVNFGVWLLQLAFGLAGSRFLMDLFALDPERTLPWRPWQIVTYMFLHSAPYAGTGWSPMHILLNMLMLAMVGGATERALGPRRFLRLYLVAGMVGGILTLLPPFRAVTVGASGAVLGVMTAWALLYPNATVLLFFVLPVPAIVVVIFLALFNLMSAAGSTGGGVSYIAHLGGMAAAFVMLRGQPWWRRLSGRWEDRARQRNVQRRAELRQRMDDILEKMHREGKESLTREDWRTLLEESKRMREK
jgi:membrane associated rhomboid family serine protease